MMAIHSYYCSAQIHTCHGPADIDECFLGLDGCHENATCYNTNGSFHCMCDEGYDGDGFLCTGMTALSQERVVLSDQMSIHACTVTSTAH